MSDPPFVEEVVANGHDHAGWPDIELLNYDELTTPDLKTKGLVKGLIDCEALAMLYGQYGTGKTFLGLDIALSVAAGQPWFDRGVRQGKVVYVAAEAGKAIRNRVAAWNRMRRKGTDAVEFRALVSPVDLCHLTQENVEHLKRHVKAFGQADLVIVDTVSRSLAGGDENSPADMGSFVHIMDRFRARLGCAVIAIHHIGKDASRGARGHSLLVSAVDTEIEVQKRDGASVAVVKKQRDGPAGAEIAFRLRQVVLGLDQDGDEVTSCVVEPMDAVPEIKLEEPKGHNGEVLNILRSVVRENGTKLMDGGRGVTVEEWRAAVEKSGKLGEHGSAKFRTNWKRVVEQLAGQKYTAGDGTYVWPSGSMLDDCPF